MILLCVHHREKAGKRIGEDTRTQKKIKGDWETKKIKGWIFFCLKRGSLICKCGPGFFFDRLTRKLGRLFSGWRYLYFLWFFFIYLNDCLLVRMQLVFIPILCQAKIKRMQLSELKSNKTRYFLLLSEENLLAIIMLKILCGFLCAYILKKKMLFTKILF